MPHPQAGIEAFVFEIDSKALRAYGPSGAGEQAVAIRLVEAGAPRSVIAHVHVATPSDAPTAPGKKVRPPFAVHRASDGVPICSVQPVGEGSYDTYGGDGAPLGRITRRGGRLLPWPRRVQWIVQPVDHGGRPLMGKVGTWQGWTWMVVLAPLYFVLWTIMGVYGLLERLIGEKADLGWELTGPFHTRWHVDEGMAIVMETRGHAYRVESQQVDQRLTYAQAVLHAWERG